MPQALAQHRSTHLYRLFEFLKSDPEFGNKKPAAKPVVGCNLVQERGALYRP